MGGLTHYFQFSPFIHFFNIASLAHPLPSHYLASSFVRWSLPPGFLGTPLFLSPPLPGVRFWSLFLHSWRLRLAENQLVTAWSFRYSLLFLWSWEGKGYDVPIAASTHQEKSSPGHQNFSGCCHPLELFLHHPILLCLLTSPWGSHWQNLIVFAFPILLHN